MNNPIIADNKPVKVNLSKGQEYHFCTCGRSRSQPFCDGSHAGTDFINREQVLPLIALRLVLDDVGV